MDLLWDAFLDTIKIWPFLWIVYLFFECIGNKRNALIRQSKMTPVLGALSGCIPQCGASVAAASLYADGIITVGTLLAVFLSTSDEAIPLMMTYPQEWQTIVKLVIIKLIFASMIGILVDYFVPHRQISRSNRSQVINKYHDLCCRQKANSIFRVAFNRSVKVVGFLLIMTIIINWIVTIIGEASLSTLLLSNTLGQPFIAALIGLIPNCVSSVLLTDLYLQGIITFGSVLAGLCTGAGAGLLVLFQQNKSIKQNLIIVTILYLLGATIGLTFHNMIGRV